MFGLTLLGTVHTAISLVALAAGLTALLRYREIPGSTALGQTYFWATVLTCITGFGIFQHGGLGAPHALGIITLIVLAIAAVAGRTQVFGRASRYVETIAYSSTLFLHMIPGLTETFTRLPSGSPVFSSPDDPALRNAVGLCFGLLVIGCLLQVRRLRAGQPELAPKARRRAGV